MLRIVDKVFAFLFPVISMRHAYLRQAQFAGSAPTHRQWFRNKGVIWFNGYPGVPKLPLVQRLRAAPSALNPVAPSTPEGEEEKDEEDPEPLCRKQH